MVMFNDVFIDDTKNGRKIPKEEYLSNGLYPIVDQGQDYIAGYSNDKSGIYEDVPVVVFGDHTRIVKYVDKPFFLGADGVKVLKAKEKDANHKYLYYVLSNAKIPDTGYNRHFKWLKELDFALVNKEKQDNIVKVLDKVGSLIENRKHQLKKLDELVKARFVEMFGDETELDRWQCMTVGEVANVFVGIVIKPTQYYVDKGVPAFRSLNIGELSVKNKDWIYFSEKGHLENSRTIVRKNDVLVVRSGAPGTSCVVTEEFDGYNAIDIIIARPNNTKINSIFLAMFTNMPHGMIQVREGVGGAAQQHFNVNKYKGLKVMLPPINLQNQFADFVQQINKSKLDVQKSLDKLETLKKALMQKYFG